MSQSIKFFKKESILGRNLVIKLLVNEGVIVRIYVENREVTPAGFEDIFGFNVNNLLQP